MKLLVLTILGLLGFLNGMLLFGNPQWFSPFTGVLVCAALPFAGAMIAVSGKQENV